MKEQYKKQSQILANKDNNTDVEEDKKREREENTNEYLILKDEGKFSYIASCLYCLANNDNLKNYLKNEEKYGISDMKRDISFNFFRVLVNMEKNVKKNYDLGYIHNSIISKNVTYKETSTNKISDFLIFLLEQLHRDDIENKKINDTEELKEDTYQNPEKYLLYLEKFQNSFIYINYAWVKEKSIKCIGCGTHQKSYSYHFTYDLNLSSAINKTIINLKKYEKPCLSIKKCIEYYSQKENIYNIYCYNCQIKTKLERSSNIYSCNNNIIFLFKGIEDQDTITNIKEYNISIKVEKNLELKSNEKIKKYELNSVIYYDCQHNNYIAYYFRQDKKCWVKCSSNNIKDGYSDIFLNNFDYPMLPAIAFYHISK